MKHFFRIYIFIMIFFSSASFGEPGKALVIDLKDINSDLHFHKSYYERGNRFDFIFIYLKNVRGKLDVSSQEIAAKCIDVKSFPLAEAGSYFVSTRLEKEYLEEEGTSLCQLHFIDESTQRKFTVSFGTYLSTGPTNPIER